MDTDNECDEIINTDTKATKGETEAHQEEMEEKCTTPWVSVCILRSFRRKPMFWEKFHSFERYGLHFCGSHAEFYMKPIHNCVDDMDLLYEIHGMMAFDDDVPLLPDYVRDLHEDISCLRIEPYRSYPAFVRLRFAWKIEYNWSRKKYEVLKAQVLIPATLRHILLDNIANWGTSMTAQLMGPALKYKVNGENLLNDFVNCIRCPQWPKEASNWPTRPRRHSWPTEDILLEVVRRGCHIVNVQNRDCRDDEYQWRLSFSVAEVLLLKSWTPIQQIVYHMLRYFAKNEKLIQKDCPKEKEVLCTYHFKTLMLWMCEQESPEWWESTLLIQLCCQLLRKLSEWLRERCCPNYFIPEANLFYKTTDLDTRKAIIERIDYFCDSSRMSQWFLRNYILPFYNKVTGRTQTTLNQAEVVLLANRFLVSKNSELGSLDVNFVDIHEACINNICVLHSRITIPYEMYQHANAKIRSFDVECKLIAPMSEEFINLESALVLLAAPNVIKCRKLRCCRDFIPDVLRLLSLGFVPDWWFQYHNFPENYESQLEKSFVYFLRAQECLGNLYGRLSDAEFELRCRMSMEFLRQSIKCEDSSSDAVRYAVAVYAAAICYANSQYQTAYNLCSTVLTEHRSASTSDRTSISDLSSVNTEPFNATHLLFMSDAVRYTGIAGIDGFLVPCQHVHDSILKSHQQFGVDLRISSTALTHQWHVPTSDLLLVNFEPLNAGCLLFIDDVARFVGFLVLCKHIHDSILKSHRQFNLDLRISPSVFAQYIMLQSTENMSKHWLLNWSAIRIVFLFDVLLLTIMKSKLSGIGYATKSGLCKRRLCVYKRNYSLNELVESVTGFSMNEDICVQLFIECSLEKLACFYQAVFEKFGLQGNTVVLCYRALYLYMYRKYDEALILCEEIFRESDLNGDSKKEFGCLNITVYPPFLAYFDEDVQCIIGLQLVRHFVFLSHVESIRRKVENPAVWLKPTNKYQWILAVFGEVLTKPALRFEYFLSKHFVARYLKLRCLIDCKSSVSEIRRAFGELQPRLPLEHRIRQFLLRKVQKLL